MEELEKRLPPHSEEAEIGVLGSMMLSSEAVSIAREALNQDDFYSRPYGALFSLICESFTEGKEPDLTILQEALKKEDYPPEMVGPELIQQIVNAEYTSSHIRDYVQIVLEGSIRRKIIQEAERLKSDAYKKDLPEVLEKAQTEIAELTLRHGESSMDKFEALARKSTLTAAEVEKRSVKWFLRPDIPKDNITLLAAEGGVGKTSIAVCIAAAVTTGKIPAYMGDFDGLPFEDTDNDYGNQEVLFLTSEDPMSEVLRERFEVAGADLTRIKFVSFENSAFSDIKFDSPFLEALIKTHRPALCIFDPIQSFILGKMGDRNVMRQNLDALTRLGQLYGCTFLLIAHTNKLGVTDARTKISDSSDLWDKARSVLMVGNTPEEGIKFLSQEKSNYAELDESYLFKIAADGTVIFQARSEKRFNDFCQEQQRTHTSGAKDEAIKFILSALKHGEIRVKDLDESAAAIGISKQTLRRAKRDLQNRNIIKYRKESQGNSQGVVWYIGSLQPFRK